MSVYIDTSILLVLIGFGKVDKDVIRFLNKQLYKKEVKVPQVVLGEALAKIFGDAHDPGMIRECLDGIHGVLDGFKAAADGLPPPTIEVTRCAKEIHEQNDHVRNMDSLILAHAIMDQGATVFFTSDKALTGEGVNRCITDLVKRGKRKQALSIPETINF